MVLVGAACFCALIQGPYWVHDTGLTTLNLIVSLVFVFTGLLLHRDPDQRTVAWALMLAGIFRSVDFSDSWNGAWPAYCLVFGGVDRLFGAWALLRYPNSALPKYQRGYLILLTSWMLAGRALIAITSTAQWNGGPPSWWWPALLPDQSLTNILNYVVNAGEGVLGLVLLVLMGRRLTQTRGLDRLVITPIIVAGLVAVIAASASAAAMMLVGLNQTPNGAYITESAVDLAIPVAFLIAAVQRTLLLRNITGLTAEVAAGSDVSAVRSALRSTLHDPTLDLVELTGTTLPALNAGLNPGPPERIMEVIRTEQGEPIAVVIADQALTRYRGLFDAAVRTSGLALRNAQLQAKAAQDKLAEVRASRVRIIEAEAAERRRLERDLHDGVQQHLLSVIARLAAAVAKTSDPEASAAFVQARDGLREILAELRDLAHGIHPALLSQGGLAVALEEVADRLPLPVRVTVVPAARVAAPLEETLYYVACEALANVVKHAGATSAAVTVRIGGSDLEMEITDDGVGGATRVIAGQRESEFQSQGLANIADRVSALDGELAIESPPGGGTRVMVRVPCG
jgi:signal transduction histidine kinase